MSLSRYVNWETIVQLNEPQYGQVFDSQDLQLLNPEFIVPEGDDFILEYIPQLHIYSFYGDYVTGDHYASYLKHDKYTNSMLIDVADVFRSANIRRGSYIISVNLFKSVWGNPKSLKAVLREISPDRTEMKFSIGSGVNRDELSQFGSLVKSMSLDGSIAGLIVDFGFNKICNISSVKFDKKDPNVFYIKLRIPAIDDIEEMTQAWFGYEVMDSYIDTVILATPIIPAASNVIPGPNFELDTSQWSSNATEFKTWDDVLDTDLPTTQRIIDMSISGSGTARLNIDYTNFSNFIFYSSAAERVDNFIYKVDKIETYKNSISTLQASTASITTFLSSSVSNIQRKIDILTNSFDHFERWLYYSGTSSLFTHDISGSITPYPKVLSSGRYVLYPTTSSIADSWYDGIYASASVYDQHNHNRLWWTIPQHILMDESNSDYVLFVEMIATHFDNLYSYIRALTQIHERDEHNDRGASNDLLYHIAKSFGWNLQNTRQLSDLWFYKLGTDDTGAHESTGSMFSMSHESQTQQIWRRIVNNLPYLLKTKGSTRSIKALMSIYGIPQTIISIKEYGGPSEEADRPQMIEDRFAYALNFKGRQSVKMNRYRLGAGTGSWSGGGVTKVVPDTIGFRFSTAYSGSSNMSLWSIENTDSTLRSVADIRLHHVSELVGTSSYSGSKTYGKLEFLIEGGSTGSYRYFSGSTGYLPLFDGDWWTVRLWTDTPVLPSVSTASFNLEVGRADDCTFGTYVHTGSVTVTAYSDMSSSNFPAWGVTPNRASVPNIIRLGGTSASLGIPSSAGTSSFFSGSMQAYKEYFSVLSSPTFREHVLNPSAYHVDEPTSSFYDLYRYFPLGLDVIRHNHVVSSSVSSSHPNRNIDFHTSAIFDNFAGNEEDQYYSVNETYYVYTPTIGPNNVRNNKIRLEDTRLIRDLSPISDSSRSTYDFSTFDSNRLAIVFSLADQVNKDIFNQFGFTELDDWIANPEYEFESEYSELKRFSNEYWKKYTADNDINAFIRILSVYDYTFFEQIRQLVPGRADLIAGILIEPNILERSKISLTKRPTVTNPQWDKTITYDIDTSGEYVSLEGTATASMDFSVRYSYLTGSIDAEYAFNIRHCYLTASIADPFIFTASSCHHLDSTHQRTGICGTIDTIRNRYSGSCAETGSYIDIPRVQHHCRYKKVIYHYSSSNAIQTKYLRHWYTAVSKSYGWHYSRSLDVSGYQIDECSTRNNSRFIGSKMSSPGFNIDSPDTVDGGPVVVIRESNPNSIFVKGKDDGGGLYVR